VAGIGQRRGGLPPPCDAPFRLRIAGRALRERDSEPVRAVDAAVVVEQL
jgi:hypothetical protein